MSDHALVRTEWRRERSWMGWAIILFWLKLAATNNCELL